MKANPKERKRVAEEFLKYYTQSSVQEVIVKQHFRRETMLIANTLDLEYPKKKIRNLKLDNLTSFPFVIINYFEHYKEPYNIYHSLATFRNGVPVFYFKGTSKEVLEERKTLWLRTATDQITAFDLFIDIDSPDLKILDKVALDTLDIFDRIIKEHDKVYIIFSGYGFHIVIKNMFKGTKEDIESAKILVKAFHDNFSELVDYKTIEARRVRKTVGSLIYKEGCKYIFKCQELSREDLIKFNYQDYIYKKVNEIK